MKILSKLTLAIASIVLMVPLTGMSANGSGQDGAKVRGDSSDSLQQFLQEGRRPSETLKQLGLQTRIPSGACLENLILCSFSATGTVAACVADLFADGALTPVCAAAFSGTGGVCAAAGATCGSSGVGTPATVRLARAGSGIIQSGSDVFRELVCAAPHRVQSTKIDWSNVGGLTLVTGITLTCTNNVVQTYGYAGTSTNTYNCGSGRLMAGMIFRTGAFMDAAGGVCRQLANTSGVTYVNGIWGGTGGTRTDRVCATGKYMVGAKVYFDGAFEADRNVLGMEVLCK